MPPTTALAGLPQPAPIRTLILEKTSFNREGVESYLRPHRDIEIVGMAGDLSMALRIALICPPDVVIVNLDDDADTARIVRDLNKRMPNARILVMLGRNDLSITRLLRHAGADDLLFGAQRPAAVVGTIRLLGRSAQRDAPARISR